jgi:hypothetical protein
MGKTLKIPLKIITVDDTVKTNVLWFRDNNFSLWYPTTHIK